MRRTCAAVTVLALVLTVLTQPAGAQMYPTPEAYIKANDLNAYVKAAVEFLQKNPNSPDAARVAMDLMMVSGAQGNRQLFNQMRDLLLLRHAGTLQSTFISAQMNVNTYRAFLNQKGNAALLQNNKALSTLWTRALRQGVHHFGSRLTADSGFLLKAALIAQDTDDQELKDALTKAINERKKEDEDLARWANICFDFEGTPDKVKKLHEMEDSTATVLTRYYLVRMTPEQRRQPAMVEVIAEYLMRQGNYAAAEEANTRLLDSKDTAQIRFWKAWSEAAKQETEKAIATLKDLREKYPDSDWSTHGSVYANELSQVDKHTAAYANALVDATDKIKAGIGVFEGEFFYRKADAVFDIKVAYVADESMELLVKRDGKPMLGYRVKGDESWLFLESEEKIRHYKEGSIIPAPTLAMGPKATGGLQYNMGFRFVQNFEQLGQAIDAIAKAEGMGEEKVLANLLTAVLRSGSVPTSSKRDGGVTHYTWLSPNVQAPKFDRTTYALDGSGKFTSFAGGKYESRYMKYGKKGELTPQMNFTWPKKETETLERPGLQEFRDLMQEVLEVFRDGEELEEAE